MNTHSLKNRMIQGVFWVAVTKALGQAITWVISIAVARMLSPQDYGLMGAAVLFTGFLLLFNELGLSAAIIRSPDLNLETASQLRWALLAINFALFVLLLLGAPLVALYFVEPALTDIIRVLSVAFLIHALGVPSSCMLQREMAFKKKSRAELAGNLVGGISTLIAAVLGFGVWSLVIGYLLQQGLSSLLYCVYRPIPFARGFSLSKVRSFIRFGFHVATARVLWYVSASADRLVVGRVLGSLPLGYYSLALQFASLPIDKVVGVVTQVALPSFSELQNDNVRLRRYFLRLVGTVALATFPMFLGLFLVAEDAVTVFLTSKWLPVVVPLKILCVASTLRAIETMNTPLLFARNRPGIPLFNSLLQTIVLPLAFLVGAKWGVNGVAIAWLVTWPVLSAIVTGQTLRVIGLSFESYLAELRHPALGGASMVLLVTVLQRSLGTEASAPVRLALSCVVGALSYVGYQALFNRVALIEVMALMRLGRFAEVRPSTKLEVDRTIKGTEEPEVTVQPSV